MSRIGILTRTLYTRASTALQTGAVSTSFHSARQNKLWNIRNSYRTMSTVNQERPLEVLLVGLGSIGSVYSHILEKVRCLVQSMAGLMCADFSRRGRHGSPLLLAQTMACTLAKVSRLIRNSTGKSRGGSRTEVRSSC